MVSAKFENDDPSRLKITEDFRPLAAVFVVAGIFLIGVAPYEPEIPSWFGLIPIAAGIIKLTCRVTEFCLDLEKVVYSESRVFFWKSSKDIPFKSIQDVTVQRGAKQSGELYLELLNRRQHRLAGFRFSEAQRVKDIICNALGQECSSLELEESAEKPSPLEILGKMDLAMGKSIKYNLTFSILGGVVLALLSPLILSL